MALVVAAATMSGCGNPAQFTNEAATKLAISAPASSIDTNCTGCNAADAQGVVVEQFTANREGVSWSVSGGDAVSGPGSINALGQYRPPSFLTADRAVATIMARTAAGARATVRLTLTPGFLQPLTPQNVALGPGGSASITGYLAVAGGATSIRFRLSSSPTGEGEGLGALGPTRCRRNAKSYTACTVAYTAPAELRASSVIYVTATVGESASQTTAAILLNTSGVTSNPATHQSLQPAPMLLGGSGGENRDYDARSGKIVDCCGGTLGALLESAAGQRYLLSNNHILARSDQAYEGDLIVHPGLIDHNCTPYLAESATIRPVARLSAWPRLNAPQTNVDAALALVEPGAVDPGGAVLELGARLPDGRLAPAPLGLSSTGGKGKAAWLGMSVAKSGRTTGLTCGRLTALDLDVSVDYFRDCAESRPYLTKLFTHQLAASGARFSDAGDSGSMLVEAATAEPVGLFFAGGLDTLGQSHSVASPAPDLLAELGKLAGPLHFVGGEDHPVHCLDYGDGARRAAQERALSKAEQGRLVRALVQAIALVNPQTGVLGATAGKSSDHPGEAAVVLYIDEAKNPRLPAVLSGVRTVLVSASAQSLAAGGAPTVASPAAIAPQSLNMALAVKEQSAAEWMKQEPAFFGVGVGQSLDSPRDAALLFYVDRKRLPSGLPATLAGLRTRYIVMDRLHVTRAYAQTSAAPARCPAP